VVALVEETRQQAFREALRARFPTLRFL
jgi:galactokinase